MAQERIVKVVDDNTLANDDGWALVRHESTGEIFFVVERSSAADEQVLNDAWYGAAQLVIEQAVRDGIVEYRDRAEGGPEEPPTPEAED